MLLNTIGTKPDIRYDRTHRAPNRPTVTKEDDQMMMMIVSV